MGLILKEMGTVSPTAYGIGLQELGRQLMVLTFRKWELYLQLLMGLAIRSWDNRLWVLHSENGNCISNSLWVWPSWTGTTAVSLWFLPSENGYCIDKFMGLAIRNWDNRLWVLLSEMGTVSINLWVWPSGTGTTDYGSCFQKMGTVSPTAYGFGLQELGQQIMVLTFRKLQLYL